MKNLFLVICALLSASAALCQESNPSTEPNQSTAAMQSFYDGNYVMRRNHAESTAAHRFTKLNPKTGHTAKQSTKTTWSAPELPANVIVAKQAAELKKRNAAIQEKKMQKRLGEKAYVFGVAADDDALK